MNSPYFCMSHPQDLSCPRDAVEMSGQALMEAADYTTTLETLETLETTQTQDLMEDCLFCLKEVKTAPPPLPSREVKMTKKMAHTWSGYVGTVSPFGKKLLAAGIDTHRATNMPIEMKQLDED